MTEPKSEGTEPSTQELPIFPTVQDIESSDKEKVLRWIQKRNSNALEDDDLDKFNKQRINGIAFLDSSFDIFNKICCLSVGASLALMRLVNEVKEKGKFIPWT
jgi:hypothetical protein